jgi:beta-glucosidase
MGVRTFGTALIALLLFAAPAAAAGRCGDHPWCNTSLNPDQRADLLIQALTPDERIGLLGGDDIQGVLGGAHAHTGTSDGVPRVGLPTTYYSDGPVGPRQGSSIGLPIPMALAATFDPEQAKNYGSVAAGEAKAKGNDVIYAPTVNIMRTPLGGRTFEGFGEDPWLVSRMAVSWIEGAQETGVMANVKHYAANNQEGMPASADPPAHRGLGGGTVGDRMQVSVEVSERALREIYLSTFEAAVKEANVASVMCSYNKLRGDYACQNKHLLTDILKGEWGFKGYVLADYGASHDTGAQLANGMDFEPWPGTIYGPQFVTTALASGQATQAEIDGAVHRILRTAFAYGFFDRDAFKDDDAQIDKKADGKVAEGVEANAITLLENSGGFLPLSAKKVGSVAVIGKDADTFKTGGGSGSITPFSTVTPRKAIEDRVGASHVAYDDGSDHDSAVAAAKKSDVAIVFAGDYETEGVDRYCLTLECPDHNGDQDGLIEAVAAANPNTIVVLETGGPVLTPWRGKVKGLLEAWYPGSQGGTAIADVLFGSADPAGRLPATFPRSADDIPTAGDPEKYPGVANVEQYKEGVLVGYRWYDAKNLTPAYEFGAGQSYTTFKYSGLHVRGSGTGLAVSFRVQNTGKRAGSDVPQLYLGLPQPGPDVVQPPRALKAFQKITLRAGRAARVTMRVNQRGLSYWNEGANDWRVANGCYGVSLGRSSRNIVLSGSFAVGGAKNCPKPATTPATCPRTSAKVTLKGVKKSQIRKVVVYLNGRKQRTLFGHRTKIGVRLPGHQGKSKVLIKVTLTSGRVKQIKATLANCKGRTARH